MSFDDFREVILAQAIEKHVSDHGIWNEYDSKGLENDGHRKFIEQHWNGKSPLSDEQIRIGFERYHNDALAAKDLLVGQGVKAAWTSALRALRNVHSVRFISVEHDESDGSHLPVQPDCIVRPHRHDANHSNERCRSIAAPVGDALLSAGIVCLAEANVKAQELDVACAMTGQFGWETQSGWGKLDLSQMQTSDFHPEVEPTDEDLDTSEGKPALAQRAADAVATVLKKSQASLEMFTYGDTCPMQWPGDEVIPLPELRVLSLQGGGSRPRNLKA